MAPACGFFDNRNNRASGEWRPRALSYQIRGRLRAEPALSILRSSHRVAAPVSDDDTDVARCPYRQGRRVDEYPPAVGGRGLTRQGGGGIREFSIIYWAGPPHHARGRGPKPKEFFPRLIDSPPRLAVSCPGLAGAPPTTDKTNAQQTLSDVHIARIRRVDERTKSSYPVAEPRRYRGLAAS
jgi:hypothetical protein